MINGLGNVFALKCNFHFIRIHKLADIIFSIEHKSVDCSANNISTEHARIVFFVYRNTYIYIYINVT